MCHFSAVITKLLSCTFFWLCVAPSLVMAESEEEGGSVPPVASKEQTADSADRPVNFQSGVVLAGVVGYLDVRHAVLLLTVLSRRDPEEGRLEKHVIPFDRALVDQVTARAWGARQDQFAAAIPPLSPGVDSLWRGGETHHGQPAR